MQDARQLVAGPRRGLRALLHHLPRGLLQGPLRCLDKGVSMLLPMLFPSISYSGDAISTSLIIYGFRSVSCDVCHFRLSCLCFLHAASSRFPILFLLVPIKRTSRKQVFSYLFRRFPMLFPMVSMRFPCYEAGARARFGPLEASSCLYGPSSPVRAASSRDMAPSRR